MTTKTHLTAQQEGVKENGIQIRTDQPASPVDGQVWIRSDLRRLIMHKDGANQVITKGRTQSVEVVGTAVDASLSDTFYADCAADTNFTVSNFPNGERFDMVIYNSSGASINIDVTNQAYYANGHDGTVPAGQRKLFTFMIINDIIVISGSVFP